MIQWVKHLPCKQQAELSNPGNCEGRGATLPEDKQQYKRRYARWQTPVILAVGDREK